MYGTTAHQPASTVCPVSSVFSTLFGILGAARSLHIFLSFYWVSIFSSVSIGSPYFPQFLLGLHIFLSFYWVSIFSSVSIGSPYFSQFLLGLHIFVSAPPIRPNTSKHLNVSNEPYCIENCQIIVSGNHLDSKPIYKISHLVIRRFVDRL